MKTNQTSSVETTAADRRRFLKLAGATLLAGVALPKVEEALGKEAQERSNYVIGLVLNPALAGLSGEVILNVYLSVSGDGTGVGLLTDPLHPAVSSHLTVQRTAQQGNQFIFEGVVSRSNTPAQVGLAFAVAAEVHAEFTTLALVLNGETFSGQGALIAWIQAQRGT
jgi:hypothetical protein